MYLLKCKIYGLEPFQSIFSNQTEAEKYLQTINPESIEDWSIHPLFVQDPVSCKDKKSSVVFSVSVQYVGNTPKPLVRDITSDKLHELVFKDFDFTHVYKIILFPHA